MGDLVFGDEPLKALLLDNAHPRIPRGREVRITKDVDWSEPFMTAVERTRRSSAMGGNPIFVSENGEVNASSHCRESTQTEHPRYARLEAIAERIILGKELFLFDRLSPKRLERC